MCGRSWYPRNMIQNHIVVANTFPTRELMSAGRCNCGEQRTHQYCAVNKPVRVGGSTPAPRPLPSPRSRASGERRAQTEGTELTSRLPYSGMASPPNFLRGTCCTAALLSVNRGVADANPRAPIALMASILRSTTGRSPGVELRRREKNSTLEWFGTEGQHDTVGLGSRW